MEKEFLAIVKAIEHFPYILFYNKVFVKTVNRNLLFYSSNLNKRIERWKWILEEFNVELKFQNGAENVCADFLSRCHLLKDNIKINKFYDLKEISEE